ncbi:MAG: type II toxin-antitoxin system RelE/ParE family toxin [Actinomycetia bacterium]|nr:type II toxin-antitoxin system RelE/ParE family toxin [Actinomycetes bacterium]
MGRYKIFIKPSAVREIERMAEEKQRQRIVARIEALSEEPRPSGCENPTGREQYRVRQGAYRIVYAIEDDRLVVYVVKVGHRSGPYR